MKSDTYEKLLFGNGTGNIRTFAVMSAVNTTWGEMTSKELQNQLSCFRMDLKIDNIQYTETGNNIFVLYNMLQKDIADFAYRKNIMSFIYGENAVPSEMTVYKGISDGRFIKEYKQSDKVNINSLSETESFLSKNGLEFEMNGDFIKSVQSANDEVVDEDELRKSLQEKRSIASRMAHRCSAMGKDDRRISVIFAKPMEKPTLIKHRLRAINPHFQIEENVSLSIPDKYWFGGAVCVYDAYRDRERFLKAINGFSEICRIDSYFLVDTDNRIWKVDRRENTMTAVEGMQIIDDNIHRVGNIMVLALASVVDGCPALKEIIDIAYVK